MSFDCRLDAERRMLSLIAGAGLPPPDEVEHEPGAVVFVWHDTRTIVCVDLEDEAGPDAGGPDAGGRGPAGARAQVGRRGRARPSGARSRRDPP